MRGAASPWVEALWGLLFPRTEEPLRVPRVEPPWCDRCGEPFSGRAGVAFDCSNCRGRRWYLRAARAGFRAEGDVLHWIHGLKYLGRIDYLPQLAAWLEEGYRRAAAELGPWDALVPVPLHPGRQRRRGFNQAEELARQLGRAAGLPVWGALRRVRATGAQARLRRSERLRNQRQAYGLNGAFDVRGRRLLIIDDVLTTGATANACAQMLRAAGALEICALTVARG